MCEQFVKLPMAIIKSSLSCEAKILYALLADRISYSSYHDDAGQYYYMGSDDKQELMQFLGCAICAFKRHIKALRDAGLIRTHQYGKGVRVYLSVVSKEYYQVVSKEYHHVVSKGYYPLNQNTKTDKLKHNSYTNSKSYIYNAISIMGTDDNIKHPSFIDILNYWREKDYHSNPVLFFNKYDKQGWKIKGEPIRKWQAIADSWEANDFAMPIYDLADVLNKVDAVTAEQIRQEQALSGGYIRLSTYNKIRDII